MLRPVANPPSRFESSFVEWDIPPEPARLQVYEDDSQSVLARNESPDLWHRWSLNPYRGCLHACAYCYARPSHEYLGFGAGSDHDTKILVKRNAAALLERAFDAPSWTGETVLFSGNTDCYQALEYRYRLTRACLEVCLRYRNPVAIITKSALVERDLDLLVALHREARVHVILSIPFHDPVTCRAIEPGTPSPARRYEAVRALSAAGIPVGVNIAPVIPGLNDRDIPAILQHARAAGARRASRILLRLPGPVEAIFVERLREQLPGRAEGVLARLRRARGGELHEARFGKRMTGEGEEWAAATQLFDVWYRRLGYDPWEDHERDASGKPIGPPTTFCRPARPGDQLRLFGG